MQRYVYRIGCEKMAWYVCRMAHIDGDYRVDGYLQSDGNWSDDFASLPTWEAAMGCLCGQTDNLKTPETQVAG